MSFPINQQSRSHPSVVQFQGRYHMAFMSDDSGHRLLYATSGDGVNWTRGPDVGESTLMGPALAVANNRLVVVFVSNDDTHRILYSVYDPAPVDAWTNAREVRESATGVSAIGAGTRVYIYFKSNDSSNRLLGTTIDF